MAWTFICPANRGIGYALTRHLLQVTKAPIIATSRRNVKGTKEALLKDMNGIDPGRLHVLELDVTDEKTIIKAAEVAKSLFPLEDYHLRLSFTIPGILYPEKSPSQIEASNLLETFQTNTIGPLLVMKHFSPFLPKRKVTLKVEEGLPSQAVWTTMSARVGSTADNSLGGWYSYRASKAAVNSFTKTFDQHLKIASGAKAMAIALHPGTVKTGLSKEFWGNVQKEKLFTPEFAAQKLVEVANGLEIEEGRGRCWDWKGEQIPP